MDDNQTPEQASDETLVSEANTSEATSEEETPENEAEKGDEGTADDAEADSSDDDEHEDEDDQPKRKKKSGLDRLKRRLEALEAENQTLRSRQPVADSGNLEAAVRAEVGDPPREQDFPDFLSYERAMIAYEADKRLVTRELRKQIASQASVQQARQAEAIETYHERIAEADKLIPGLAATIAKVNVNIRNDIAPLIIESEKGALIAHYLSQNPKKAAELNSLPEKLAAKEIGRLEARLSFPKTQTATKAPSPVRPPKGGTAGAMSPSQEIEAYIRKTYGR